MPKVYSLDPPSQNNKLCPLTKISYGRVLGVLSSRSVMEGCWVCCPVYYNSVHYNITAVRQGYNGNFLPHSGSWRPLVCVCKV